MGSAILSGVLDSCEQTRLLGAEPRITRFIACVNSTGSAEGLKSRFAKYADRLTVLQADNVSSMRDADVVLLGCKPYMAETVLSAAGVREALSGKLVISVLAGTPVKRLQGFISGGGAAGHQKASLLSCFIVRAMLNIAAEFGKSMTVIETADIPEHMMEFTNWIFLQLGKTAPVTPDLYDVGGVLAGTSGVFLSVALDGILDGAVSQGLKRAQARALVTQTLVGLAKQLEEGNTPDILRERVSSPRGTTIEGLMSLEEDRVRHAYTKAVIKATQRAHAI
jgi:pyrroline-5-carboxylate reductase